MNYRRTTDHYYDHFIPEVRSHIRGILQANKGKFYKIPKVFFDKSGFFQPLSSESKIIYGILRDRQELADRFNRPELDGRKPVYMTVQEAMKILNCGNKKAIKVLKELESAQLIERIRQGLNKPCKIYVRDVLQNI